MSVEDESVLSQQISEVELDTNLELYRYKLELERDELVILDVGGKIFKTMKSTLSLKFGEELGFVNMTNTFFTSLLKHGRNQRDKNGNIYFFVDRDPKFFPIILNYFRNGGDISCLEIPQYRHELLQEINHYSMIHLHFLVSTISENQKFGFAKDGTVYRLGKILKVKSYPKYYNYVELSLLQNSSNIQIGLIFSDKEFLKSSVFDKFMDQDDVGIWANVPEGKLIYYVNRKMVYTVEIDFSKFKPLDFGFVFKDESKGVGAKISSDVHPDLADFKQDILQWRKNNVELDTRLKTIYDCEKEQPPKNK
jgi:hypothetical protein